MLTATAKAEISNSLLADDWVDSIYQKLTVAERVGQLIDLRIIPESDNIQQLYEIINKYHIGSVTITGGDVNASVKLINVLRATMKVPPFVTAESYKSFGMPFSSAIQMPLPETYLAAEDKSLLYSTISRISELNKEFGINGVSYSPLMLNYSEASIDCQSMVETAPGSFFHDVPKIYNQHQFVSNTDLYFNFSKDFDFSLKTLDSWNTSEWKEKLSGIQSAWDGINCSSSIVTIKSIPDFPENEAVHFNKKVINPMLWKNMQFGGILAADLDAIGNGNLNSINDGTVRSLLKMGCDKLIISTNADITFTALMDGLNGRYFRQNEIKGKVKRLLRLKYQSGLSLGKIVYEDNLQLKLEDPYLINLNFQVYTKATKSLGNEDSKIPYKELDDTNFASLCLGFSELKVFQETLEKYAPFVHYMLPDVSFDPYDLKILSEQLVNFDHVIIGLHTAGLMELDQSTHNFLEYLNEQTNVILVFLGKKLNANDFEEFGNQIFVHEDNRFTEQIAAQTVFGVQNPHSGRLGFSTPEMQRMDSRVLKKIDKIVKEAISAYATPGCQVLVARNGSVIMEKGYGYYTYDSIMPVDTRTIYDLASITKVAATTQAVMKLSEQGKINLDSTLGAYLPELDGSNKASLVIKDVLAHQSGLRAFYPFWLNTIGDKDEILHYYKDIPDDNYTKTVAYGMFAAKELKDSLWQWTVETKLRRKRHRYKPYDYKYSDLGFYLLQILVENVTKVPLDVYVDSVFYKPMGMSTMTYNPLCKFPLKRITPTERDKEFRHVLVWGTVHDQIAAMKGGVSGHAGLFSNAHDIAKIMQMQLQDGTYGGRRFLHRETVDKFTTQQFEDNRRGLGWDKPDKDDGYSPPSRYAGFNSFGHRGFTGTIAWADPTFNLVFVFLSNRIYPDMGNSKLVSLNIRKRIHDVVYESMWNFEKQYN